MNRYWGNNIEMRPGEIARNRSANNLMTAIRNAKEELMVGQKIKLPHYEMQNVMVGKTIKKVLKKKSYTPYVILDFYPDFLLCESCTRGHYKESFRWDDVAKGLGYFRGKDNVSHAE